LGGTVAMRQQRANSETSAWVWQPRTPRIAREVAPLLENSGEALLWPCYAVRRSAGPVLGGAVQIFGQFRREFVLEVAELEVEGVDLAFRMPDLVLKGPDLGLKVLDLNLKVPALDPDIVEFEV
jgi:hypothetical protein